MKSYEINEDTLAIIPQNNNTTIVFEKDDNFVVEKSSYKIMEESCEYFGSSIAGRKQGTTALTGLTHKVPIIIEETNNIIFFPTKSSRDEDCIWLSLNNIVDYKKDNKRCIITFKDGKKVSINSSYGVIDNQVLRATRLQMMLLERKNNKKSGQKVKKTKK